MEDHVKETEGRYQYLAIAVIVIIIVTQVISGYVIYLRLDNWNDRSSFGEMFGAVNTLFSGLALGGVIFAILLQRQELKYQRRELELTRQELTRSAGAQEGSATALASQVREAARSYQATVLMQLIQEWNSPELYAAVSYIHSLRRKWKEEEPDNSQWSPLAKKWVAERARSEESVKKEEWMKRRRVSQFLSKMGYMMLNGYISRNDLFGVIAEAKRILIVLVPIEKSIIEYFQDEPSLGDWDVSFPKIAFDRLIAEYDEWFDDEGGKLLVL